MIVSTTETVPGQEVAEILGVVTGNIVQARNIGRDLQAGLRSVVGGRVGVYSRDAGRGPRRGDAPDDRGGREPERRRRGQCALHHQRHQPGHVGDLGLWHCGQATVGAPSLHRLPPTRCRCSRFLDTRKGGA